MQDIFMAGMERNAASVIWAMAYLMKHPRVMKKAEEEIRYLIGKKGFVDEDDIQRLSYLEAVVKETMRLQPSGCDNIRCGSKVSMWRQGSGWSRLPWCLRSWCPRRCRTEALRLLRRRNNTNQIEFGTALGSVSLSVAGLTKTKV
ncbi:hypothetical protein ACOSQ2_011388 [Xanthoceras sorbifolium]